MNDTPQDAWFHTREGERIGPVSFAALRAKAAEGALNPRLDLVWTQGMEAWKPAGEIEGLFERRATVEAAETLAPKAEPYQPPASGEVAERMTKEDGWPGVRRRGYIFGTMIFPALWMMVLGVVAKLLKVEFGPEMGGWLVMASIAAPIAVILWAGIQRLPNLGMSRWWWLGNFVPLLNLWVGYRCFACPAGYAFHKKLDAGGVALAILYWLALVLTVVATGLAVAILAGALGTPELRQQVREFLDQARQTQLPQP
jgi:hypothetical protein